MTDDKLVKFTERYETQSTPWDTGITPPEIVSIVAELPAGKALDLGCGTGTNVQYLLEHGWQADGIDFVAQAILTAHQKLAGFPPERFAVYCHDVTKLNQRDGLRAPYDLVIDIGCGHGLDADKQLKYARDVAALLKPHGIFMLYAHYPSEGRPDFGWTADDVHRLFAPHFEIAEQVLGIDSTRGDESGWYRLVKRH